MMLKRLLLLTSALFLSSSQILAQGAQRYEAENAELETLAALRYQTMDREMQKVMEYRIMAMDEAMYKVSHKKKERFFFIPRQSQVLLRLGLNPTMLL